MAAASPRVAAPSLARTVVAGGIRPAALTGHGHAGELVVACGDGLDQFGGDVAHDCSLSRVFVVVDTTRLAV